MTTPDAQTPDDLVEPEGVDAGSAASSAEGDAGAESRRDLLGPPATSRDADDGATHAYPDDVRTREEQTGPGQQVQLGEG